MDELRFLIADDHPMVAGALSRVAEDLGRVIGTTTSVRDTIRQALADRPNVLILDISLSDGNGFQVLARLRRDLPSCKIVIVTMHTDPACEAEARLGGAAGFVCKAEREPDIREALTRVVIGSEAFVTTLAPSSAASSDGLTPRQRAVLGYVAEGLTANEIAAKLGVGPKVIEFHKARLKQKLGASTSAELVRKAVAMGIVRNAGP